MAPLGLQVDVRHVLSGEQETGGDGGLWIFWMEKVTGDLLLHKLIIGEVGVEGVDDPVAITPGVGANLVVLKAVRLRETRKVKPMLRPVLAVSGRSKQTVDEIFVGLRIGIFNERFYFRRRGRQAGEVERKSAD